LQLLTIKCSKHIVGKYKKDRKEEILEEAEHPGLVEKQEKFASFKMKYK
jgi:hypothetical protein